MPIIALCIGLALSRVDTPFLCLTLNSNPDNLYELLPKICQSLSLNSVNVSNHCRMEVLRDFGALCFSSEP